MEPRIAIIGAGNVGGALGTRLCASGYDVTFGVRPGSDVGDLLERCGGRARTATPAEAAAAADVVFVAVPGNVAVEAARALGDLSGKVLVDCNNALRWDNGPVWAPPPEGSLAAALARAVPGARVVKAFNTFGAEFHADPRLGGGGASVPMAGDDAAAKATVADIARRAGFDPLDAGPLRNAGVLENMAMLWIHLAMVGGHGRQIAFRLEKRA
jgi:predicted dinucleotide-binding enzyme